MCPASDGGFYDGWRKPGVSSSTLRAYSPAEGSNNPRLEVAREVCPSDSHCDFANGYTQPSAGTGVGNAFSNFGQRTALSAIAPLISECVYASPLYAFRFRVNGSPVGSLTYGNYTQLRSARVNASKGDIIEVDVWFRVTYTPSGSAPNAAGKGVVGVDVNWLATSAPIPFVLAWSNVNMVPFFDKDLQTYEVTIAGHTGWTLKDGTDGPHKIVTGGGWTRQLFSSNASWGTGIAWENTAKSAKFWLRYDSEIPLLVFQPGSLFGSSAATIWYYRPRNAATQSYRKSTQTRNVYNSDGSLNAAAGTVTHAPCGPWDQAGTTVFDLIDWNSGIGGYIPGRSGFSSAPTIPEQPTSITLTRVSL
jgi:hypothetical protein